MTVVSSLNLLTMEEPGTYQIVNKKHLTPEKQRTPRLDCYGSSALRCQEQQWELKQAGALKKIPNVGGVNTGHDPARLASLILSHCLFSGSRVHVCVLSLFSCVRLFVSPWTVAHQAPLSVGFSRQEYWSGLPDSPPGDLPIQKSNPHLLQLLHCRQILY